MYIVQWWKSTVDSGRALEGALLALNMFESVDFRHLMDGSHFKENPVIMNCVRSLEWTCNIQCVLASPVPPAT